MRRDANDELVLIARAVQHACVAGSCGLTAREIPEAKRGLDKARRFHSHAAARLLDEMVASGRSCRNDHRAQPPLGYGTVQDDG